MRYDLIIVGAGMVGSTLACALAKYTSLSIAILEAKAAQPRWSNAHYHHRVSAISPASVRIFKAIDVWPKIIAKRVAPFKKMFVWDELSGGEISFDCQNIAANALGYIIENLAIEAALHEKLQQYPHNIHVLTGVTIADIERTETCVSVLTTNGDTLEAPLVIGADGAKSFVREKAQIEVAQFDYEQVGIVATVKTAKPHNEVARQVFLASGPLAFLPLSDANLCSIVWSLPRAQNSNYMKATANDFAAMLTEKMAAHYGEVSLMSERFSFPLLQQNAKNYIADRIALVGDAAHIVHPLAGLGVNIGLLDAASLFDVLTHAIHKKRNYASVATLRLYERWRMSDNFFMMKGIDLLQKTFAMNAPIFNSVRSFGLNMTDQFTLAKNYLTQQAVGNRADLPTLAAHFDRT